MSSRIFIVNYFKRFPDYRFDRSMGTMAHFKALAKQQQWSNDERKSELLLLRTELALQFNETYGEDATDIQGWEKLCHAIGANPAPTTVDECKKLFKRTHVNLVDLVDAQGTKDSIARTHPTEIALSKYTKRQRKYFDLKEAKAGGLLKFLLRRIIHPGSRRR